MASTGSAPSSPRAGRAPGAGRPRCSRPAPSPEPRATSSSPMRARTPSTRGAVGREQRQRLGFEHGAADLAQQTQRALVDRVETGGADHASPSPAPTTDGRTGRERHDGSPPGHWAGLYPSVSWSIVALTAGGERLRLVVGQDVRAPCGAPSRAGRARRRPPSSAACLAVEDRRPPLLARARAWLGVLARRRKSPPGPTLAMTSTAQRLVADLDALERAAVQRDDLVGDDDELERRR